MVEPCGFELGAFAHRIAWGLVPGIAPATFRPTAGIPRNLRASPPGVDRIGMSSPASIAISTNSRAFFRSISALVNNDPILFIQRLRFRDSQSEPPTSSFDPGHNRRPRQTDRERDLTLRQPTHNQLQNLEFLHGQEMTEAEQDHPVAHLVPEPANEAGERDLFACPRESGVC